jgi:hypothetical protein
MSPLTESQKQIIRKKIQEHPNKSKEEIRDELDFEAPLRAISALMRGMKTRKPNANLSKEHTENIKAGIRLKKSNQEISKELQIDEELVEEVRKRIAPFLKKIDQTGPKGKWEVRAENSSLIHAKSYVPRKIRPEIRNNNTHAEIVWTYLVGRKYEDDHKTLSKTLCGQEEIMPADSKIWLEAHLQPTRQNEGSSWMVCADLSVGHLEKIENLEIQVRSKGSWVCICESKWKADIDVNKHYAGTNQLSKLIDHALLLHDKMGVFPERVYVTLITPQSFRNGWGLKTYYQVFNKYCSDRKLLEEDLRKCPLDFLDYDTETLVKRLSHLKLNWVTFEELLVSYK